MISWTVLLPANDIKIQAVRTLRNSGSITVPLVTQVTFGQPRCPKMRYVFYGRPLYNEPLVAEILEDDAEHVFLPLVRFPLLLQNQVKG